MIKSFQILKTYYKLAKVKFYLIFFEFLFLLIPSILSVISPVIAANIISALTVYDFDKAIFELSIEFSFIVISAISYFAYHLISTKVNRTIIWNFEDYVYSNIKNNKNINSISLSVVDNIWVCLDFNKELLYKLCFFIKSIILIFIIIYFNFYIGLAMIGVSLLTFFLLQITDNKIKKRSKEFSSLNSESLELFNSIQQNISNEQNPAITNSLKDKYFGYVSKAINTNNKISLYYNINNNLISLILKTAVFLATIYLIGQVRTTILTFSLYLILTPYLTSSSQNLISFFELFSKFGVIENILKEFDALKFQSSAEQSEKTNFSTFNLYFYQVFQLNKNYPIFENLTFDLPFKKSIMFVGEKGCGKKPIFEMLQRKISPSKGSIFIDDKNINDIDTDEYNKLISFTTNHPYFYNISIYENLFMVCENKTKISKTIKDFGLKEKVDLLPQKINTIINPSFDESFLFMLGLIRSYLSGSKIICVYESPENVSKTDLILIKNIMKKIKQNCSLVLFSHTQIYDFVADNVLIIENGIIKSAK